MVRCSLNRIFFVAYFLLSCFLLTSVCPAPQETQTASSPSSPKTQIQNLIKGFGSSGFEMLTVLFSTLKINQFAIDGYFIACYLEALTSWAELHLATTYSQNNIFKLFNLFDIKVSPFGTPVYDTPRKITDFVGKEPTFSSDYASAEIKAKEMLSKFDAALTRPQISTLITILSSNAIRITSLLFPVPSLDSIIRKEAGTFIQEIINKVNSWLELKDDTPSPHSGLKALASIISKEINGDSTALSDQAVAAADKPFGSSSPFLSPLMMIFAFVTQLVVQSLVIGILPSEMISVLERFKNWLSSAIEDQINLGAGIVDLGEVVVKFVEQAIEANPALRSMGKPPGGRLTWGLAIGILASIVCRMGSPNYAPLTTSEVEKLVSHIKLLMEEGSKGTGVSFYSFFNGLDGGLIAKVTQWLGCTQTVARLAIKAINKYNGATITPFDRQVIFPIPFEMADLLAGFPITPQECPEPLADAVDVRIVSWIIRLIGKAFIFKSILFDRNMVTQDVAPAPRINMPALLLVEIPSCFCEFYSWALAATAPSENINIKELEKYLPFDVQVAQVRSGSGIERLWKQIFFSKDPGVMDRISTLAQLLKKSSAEQNLDTWISTQLITVAAAMSNNTRWNGIIGPCKTDQKKKDEKEEEEKQKPEETPKEKKDEEPEAKNDEKPEQKPEEKKPTEVPELPPPPPLVLDSEPVKAPPPPQPTVPSCGCTDNSEPDMTKNLTEENLEKLWTRPSGK